MRALQWGEPVELGGHFDLVIACDCAYRPVDYPALASTIARLGAPCLLSWQSRGKQERQLLDLLASTEPAYESAAVSAEEEADRAAILACDGAERNVRSATNGVNSVGEARGSPTEGGAGAKSDAGRRRAKGEDDDGGPGVVACARLCVRARSPRLERSRGAVSESSRAEGATKRTCKSSTARRSIARTPGKTSSENKSRFRRAPQRFSVSAILSYS